MESTQAQVAVEPAEPRTIWHCPKCGSDQGLDRFYRSPKKASGFLSWCKSCYAARDANPQYRKNRRLYLAEYGQRPSVKAIHRERVKTPHAKAVRKVWRRTDAFRQKRKEYMAHMTPEMRERWRVYRRAYERAHRTKNLARLLTSLMRRFGYLVPGPCAKCGHAKVVAHHPDYSRPLDVIWLCRPCHVLLHHPLPQPA